MTKKCIHVENECGYHGSYAAFMAMVMHGPMSGSGLLEYRCFQAIEL